MYPNIYYHGIAFFFLVSLFFIFIIFAKAGPLKKKEIIVTFVHMEFFKLFLLFSLP